MAEAIAANEVGFGNLPENLVFRASKDQVKAAGGIAEFYLQHFK